MAGLSDGRESNPVKRGAWLARRIIAEPPDDPPPNVPALKEETKALTLRERLEQHRNQNGCMQCHTKIDPWGVALEEFDAGGRLKQQAVDAHSKLPGPDRSVWCERAETIPRRRPDRSGGLQLSQAFGDVCERPQPDVQ
jgi:hypothetical protein